MTTIRIEFDRIGRNHTPPAFEADDVDLTSEHAIEHLESAIDRHIRRHLNSRFFGWSINDDGVLLIEGGRFGRGTYTELETTP